ncbi:MAG: SAM-dependent methyltransferase [Thermoplasmata archaeon]|nr:SAM-dependent methyltransferase [Thermoplasmata archaeon]
MAVPSGPAEVVARLRDAAGEGVLRFDRFMELALYSPGGFYDSDVPALGPAGAFYTAAHVTPLFGAALARRLEQEQRRLGIDRPFRVVELGPGDGTLAFDVAHALPAGGPAWEWTFVERSPRLRAGLKARIAAEGAGTPVTFGFSDALGERGTFVGAVVANEFLDALPFRRVVRRGAEWRELGVRWAGSRFEWAEEPGPSRVPGEPLPDAEDGTRYELLERSEGSLREVADHLAEGVALFLDYGASTGELVRGHPSGTLAALRAHQAVDPLDAPGTADLSAFVDFTRVRAAAVRAGLVERSFRRQSEALAEWGFGDLLEAAAGRAPSAEATVKLRLAAKNVLFGFDTFQVLELASGRSATS